jgi:hypothetical protein
MDETPELDRVNNAIPALFQHLLCEAEYINRSNGKVPTYRFAEYLLLCMKEELKRKFPDSDMGKWMGTE